MFNFMKNFTRNIFNHISEEEINTSCKTKKTIKNRKFTTSIQLTKEQLQLLEKIVDLQEEKSSNTL